MPRLYGSALAAAVAATGLVLLSLPATAEEPGRYTMTPADGGFIRLDTQTGAMSLCSGREGEWACRAMPDDQRALQDQIARLEDENRALKDENRRLEDVMTTTGILQILLFFAVIWLFTKPIGLYMARVFAGERSSDSSDE